MRVRCWRTCRCATWWPRAPGRRNPPLPRRKRLASTQACCRGDWSVSDPAPGSSGVRASEADAGTPGAAPAAGGPAEVPPAALESHVAPDAAPGRAAGSESNVAAPDAALPVAGVSRAAPDEAPGQAAGSESNVAAPDEALPVAGVSRAAPALESLEVAVARIAARFAAARWSAVQHHATGSRSVEADHRDPAAWRQEVAHPQAEARPAAARLGAYQSRPSKTVRDPPLTARSERRAAVARRRQYAPRRVQSRVAAARQIRDALRLAQRPAARTRHVVEV